MSQTKPTKCFENLVAIASIISFFHGITNMCGVKAVLKFLKVGGHCEAMLDVTKNVLLTFKGICMKFSLELRKKI